MNDSSEPKYDNVIHLHPINKIQQYKIGPFQILIRREINNFFFTNSLSSSSFYDPLLTTTQNPVPLSRFSV